MQTTICEFVQRFELQSLHGPCSGRLLTGAMAEVWRAKHSESETECELARQNFCYVNRNKRLKKDLETEEETEGETKRLPDSDESSRTSERYAAETDRNSEL